MSAGNDPIVIWGAGAIGGAIGAFFVRAGHDVLFVDQDAAMFAIARGILSLFDGG